MIETLKTAGSRGFLSAKLISGLTAGAEVHRTWLGSHQNASPLPPRLYSNSLVRALMSTDALLPDSLTKNAVVPGATQEEAHPDLRSYSCRADTIVADHSRNSIFLTNDSAAPMPFTLDVSIAMPIPVISGASFPKTRVKTSAIGISVVMGTSRDGRSTQI